jgi:hypothetical protein
MNKDLSKLAQKYIFKHDNSKRKYKHYRDEKEAINNLFQKTYHFNIELSDILVKVATLNRFYSTGILDVYHVALKIKNLNIDDDLKSGNPSIISKIAKVKVGKDRKPRIFYSFATKYCHKHEPMKYPIYDSFVRKTLIYFKKKKYINFNINDLNKYEKFIEIVDNLRVNCNLQHLNYDELDTFLWTYGKENFANKSKNISK